MTAAPLPGVTCSSCGEQVSATGSFCESCGTELSAPVFSASPPGYTAQCPVCSLDESAVPGAISAEGYCETCGRKVPSGRDHVELDLGVLAGVTDRGLRHQRNEDAMAMATAETADGLVAVAVVCDGVSTSPRADEASLAGTQAAVRMLLTSVRRGDDPQQASLAAMRQAHLALSSLGTPAQAPSVTYISATISEREVTVCWLGDSRAYWLSAADVADAEAGEAGEVGVAGASSKRLTTDDSLAEEMMAADDITEAQAMASPHAHVITRWLGADVDRPQAHVLQFTPPGPGVVLVCSDGLWNYRPDAAGLARLALPDALTDPLSAAADMVQFAINAGGMDNITVVLAPFPLVRPAP